MSDVRVTAGGKALLSEIRASGMSIPVWCEHHGLDRIQVQRVINGERWQRITVDFANSIDRASEGRIPYTMFLPSTARSTDSGELASLESESSADESAAVESTGT